MNKEIAKISKEITKRERQEVKKPYFPNRVRIAHLKSVIERMKPIEHLEALANDMQAQHDPIAEYYSMREEKCRKLVRKIQFLEMRPTHSRTIEQHSEIQSLRIDLERMRQVD